MAVRGSPVARASLRAAAASPLKTRYSCLVWTAGRRLPPSTRRSGNSLKPNALSKRSMSSAALTMSIATPSWKSKKITNLLNSSKHSMEPNLGRRGSGWRSRSLLARVEEIVGTPVRGGIATATAVIRKDTLQGSARTERADSLQTAKVKGSEREGGQERGSTADRKRERGILVALPPMMTIAAVLRDGTARAGRSLSGTKRREKTRKRRKLEGTTAVQVHDIPSSSLQYLQAY